MASQYGECASNHLFESFKSWIVIQLLHFHNKFYNSMVRKIKKKNSNVDSKLPTINHSKSKKTIWNLQFVIVTEIKQHLKPVNITYLCNQLINIYNISYKSMLLKLPNNRNATSESSWINKFQVETPLKYRNNSNPNLKKPHIH